MAAMATLTGAAMVKTTTAMLQSSSFWGDKARSVKASATTRSEFALLMTSLWSRFPRDRLWSSASYQFQSRTYSCLLSRWLHILYHEAACLYSLYCGFLSLYSEYSTPLWLPWSYGSCWISVLHEQFFWGTDVELYGFFVSWLLHAWIFFDSNWPVWLV